MYLYVNKSKCIFPAPDISGNNSWFGTQLDQNIARGSVIRKYSIEIVILGFFLLYYFFSTCFLSSKTVYKESGAHMRHLCTLEMVILFFFIIIFCTDTSISKTFPVEKTKQNDKKYIATLFTSPPGVLNLLAKNTKVK